MAKLILSFDHNVLKEFQLDKERISIGRKASNDIHIDNLAVSGEHAVILKVGNYFYIEDQESTNGTDVNDKLVKSQLLQSGDIISFGKHQLKFIQDTSLQKNNHHSDEHAGFEKTVFMRPEELNEMMQASAKSSIVEAASDEMPLEVPPENVAEKPAEKPIEVEATELALGRIQVLNGSNAGRELVLNKALTTLGKTGVQVAVITKRAHGYFITHIEGKVFPIVNGVSKGSQAHALSNHDVIELAGVKMEFFLDKV